MNYSQKTLREPLNIPFYYGEKFITHAELRRLYDEDIEEFNRYKMMIPSNINDASKSIRMVHTYLSKVISGFYANEEKITGVSTERLLEMMPYHGNTLHLFDTHFMLQKGRSIITTSYECKHCGAKTVFDLDPDSPIDPETEKREPERQLMEDFLQFREQKICRTGMIFKHKLIYPRPFKHIDGTEDIMRTWDIRYPSFKTILDNDKDQKRSKYRFGWDIWESLVSLNDMTEQETKEIKKINGFDTFFFEFEQQERRAINEKLEEYTTDEQHKFTCYSCKKEQESMFDRTNFIEFLNQR